MPVVVQNGLTLNKAMVLFQNRINTSNIIYNAQATGSPAINAIDPATWNSWTWNTGGGWLGLAFANPANIDTVAISSHNIATSGATQIVVQNSSDNATWSNVMSYTPLTNDDIILVFQRVSMQYWRIRIDSAPARIGYISMGLRLEFPHPPIDSYTPLHRARTYTKFFNDSLKGQFLGNRVMATGASTDVDLGFVNRAWLEGNISGFETAYNQGQTFFYAGCPSMYPLDMGYCRAGSPDESVAIEWIEGNNLANLSFSVQSFVGT